MSRLEQLQSLGRALPGARAALAALAARPEVVQGLLTGNLREVARLKLAAFGLDQFIAWEFSAFAEDGSERLELLDAARSRALVNADLSIATERPMLIGDTNNDVSTARGGHVSIIAVASGQFTVSELRDAGPARFSPAWTVGRPLRRGHLDDWILMDPHGRGARDGTSVQLLPGVSR
ncbi:haloacid dehalogenase-like hydrolase [Actinospica robiniae]|uniref:haloacid dehalogenase-like hydrolase n=1 Tax=Actinospica robiniae TaxID=304901 RepID=UPI00146FB7A3|nr:haloacid dehalogenase-like hydrolase [Actinospica robiniae]